MLSNKPPGPTNFENPSAFPTNKIATKSPRALRARLLNHVEIVHQDADKQIRLSKPRYKDGHDRKISNLPLSFTTVE